MPADLPHRFCCAEDLARIGYDGRDTERDLAAWRRRGPRTTTEELIDVIRNQGVEGASRLDIGAGVGMLHVSLLEAGAATAVESVGMPSRCIVLRLMAHGKRADLRSIGAHL